MERGAYGHHQFQLLSDCGQSRCRVPRIEGRRFRALNVIQIQLGNQRQVKPDLFATPGQTADIRPGRLHVFFLDIAQPATEYREPISVTHHAASFSRKSTRRTNGSNPTTLGPSATKLERALMS